MDYSTKDVSMNGKKKCNQACHTIQQVEVSDELTIWNKIKQDNLVSVFLTLEKFWGYTDLR